MKKGRNRELAFSAMLAALAWCFLLFARLYSPSALFITLGAVFSLYVAARSLGLKWGLAVFAVSSLLGLLYPGPGIVLPYLLFAGPYLLMAFFFFHRLSGKKALLARWLFGTLLIWGISFLFLRLLTPLSPLLKRLERWQSWLWLLAPAAVVLFDRLLAGMEIFYRSYLEKNLRH